MWVCGYLLQDMHHSPTGLHGGHRSSSKAKKKKTLWLITLFCIGQTRHRTVSGCVKQCSIIPQRGIFQEVLWHSSFTDHMTRVFSIDTATGALKWALSPSRFVLSWANTIFPLTQPRPQKEKRLICTFMLLRLLNLSKSAVIFPNQEEVAQHYRNFWPWPTITCWIVRPRNFSWCLITRWHWDTESLSVCATFWNDTSSVGDT